MKKMLFGISFILTLSSCADYKKKEEIFKCVVTSCKEIQPSSVHDDINRPLGYRLETSCERSFRSKKIYAVGDTIEVTKITYE